MIKIQWRKKGEIYTMWAFLIVDSAEEQTVLYSKLAYHTADLSRGVM